MPPRSPKAYQVLALLENPTQVTYRRLAGKLDFTSSSLLTKTTKLCILALGTSPKIVSEISQTPMRAAKYFRNTKPSLKACGWLAVGFHLDVPSFLLAHSLVQKCCEITSDLLVTAATSSFQLQIAHRLKHWIVDFLSFEMVYSMHHLDFRNNPDHSWQMTSKLFPRFLIALLNLDLLWDGLPMLGKDSVTILHMFHDILEKETPFVVPMVTKGWRIGEVEAVRPLHGGEQWAEGNGLLRQSLQVGSVPPSGPSPCTYIPRQRGGRCALNEMNGAGCVGLAPPAFPNFVIDVAVASVA
ncbi:hypothetical protein AAG906_015145 [Vitis piasezkii]